MNTVDSRYAAGSANVKIPESLETSFNQHQASSTNIYRTPSHEVKTPDFSYGSSLGTPALDTNRQTPSPSSIPFSDNNQNFNLPQTEYRSPFTGPIPNPHLYTGAMPPLFKAKPFDSLPQGTSFDSPPIAQSNNQYSSLVVGTASANVENKFSLGSSFDASERYNPSPDSKTTFSGPPNQQYSQQQYQNGGSSFQPSNDNHQLNPSSDLGSSFPTSQSQRYNEQIFQNGGSSLPNPNENSQFPQTGGSLDEGYVDELPPGAETASGPEDQFAPPSYEENHANDNRASNSDHRQTLHSSSQSADPSVTSSINVGVGQSELGQDLGAGSENVNQPASYGIQVSSDGQHVIHYEQSPVIDLSSVGSDERRKNSNDSSASSSSSTGAIEDPPVVLQNADGTYGINATWPGAETSQISWPDGDGANANIASATSSPFANDFPNESGKRVEDVETSPGSLDASAEYSGGSGQENASTFNGYNDQYSSHDSSHQSFQDSVQDPGSRKVETPGGSTTEEPFLEALVKSYDSLKKDARQKERGDHGGGEASFDPRLIHTGSGFQNSHSRPVDSSAENLRPVNRSQGAKRNKQVPDHFINKILVSSHH